MIGDLAFEKIDSVLGWKFSSDVSGRTTLAGVTLAAPRLPVGSPAVILPSAALKASYSGDVLPCSSNPPSGLFAMFVLRTYNIMIVDSVRMA
jgi:hypothetical protein